MKHTIKLPSGEFLNIFEVEKQKKTELKNIPTHTHHVWIRDRSGSMSYDLPQLMKDLYERVKQLPVGDIVSLGWFSGRNQFGWDVVGFKITDNQTDFDFLKNQLDKNRNSIGLTCYSDILTDAKQSVIEKYNTLLDNFSLIFFTDGYPNVDSEREIFNVVKQLEPLVTTALIVGYGNYYNKELLSQMAETIGGVMTHSQKLADFSITLHEFLQDSLEVEKKVEISIPIKSNLVFTVNNKQINTYTQSDNNTILFSPSKRNKDYIYYVSTTPHFDLIQSLDEHQISNRKSSVEPVVKGLYAYAYIMSNRTKVDQAISVIANQIGDVAIVESLFNAFTPEEYGKAEDLLRKAVGGASKRLLKGYNTKYLPADDAYCIVDLVADLQNADDVYFYPYHELFEYNRIGVKSEVKEGLPVFKANPNPKVSLNNVVWNETMLNLSLQAQIHGTVEFMNEQYKTFGFQKFYPTFVFRNYTIIKDGFVNVEKLPVSMPEHLVEYLNKKVTNLVTKQDDVYVIDLKALPVMNRSMGKQYKSATELSKLSIKLLEHQAKHKVYNDYLKDLKDTVKQPSLLTEEAQEFLKSQGIGFNGFSPQTERGEPVDYYMAKEFDIKIGGFSSLPSINKVNEKTTKINEWDGKKKKPEYTASESLIQKYIVQLKQDLSTVTDDKSGHQTLALVESKVKENKREMIKIRTMIQKAKFSVILGKTWFDEFTSRDEQSLTVTVDGTNYEVSFTVREVKIDI